MLMALVIVTAGFLLLGIVRVGAARRAQLMAQWPALLLGGGAVAALSLGRIWGAIGLAGAAVLVWTLTSSQLRNGVRPQQSRPDPRDAEACAALGVSFGASHQEIRAAYRTKMAQAHPDRGGDAAEAARLNAAREWLLKR